MRYTIKEVSNKLNLSETTINSLINKLSIKFQYRYVVYNTSINNLNFQKTLRVKTINDADIMKISSYIKVQNKQIEINRIEKITIGLREKYNKNKNHVKKYMNSKHFDFFSTTFGDVK